MVRYKEDFFQKKTITNKYNSITTNYINYGIGFTQFKFDIYKSFYLTIQKLPLSSDKTS